MNIQDVMVLILVVPTMFGLSILAGIAGGVFHQEWQEDLLKNDYSKLWWQEPLFFLLSSFLSIFAVWITFSVIIRATDSLKPIQEFGVMVSSLILAFAINLIWFDKGIAYYKAKRENRKN